MRGIGSEILTFLYLTVLAFCAGVAVCATTTNIPRIVRSSQLLSELPINRCTNTTLKWCGTTCSLPSGGQGVCYNSTQCSLYGGQPDGTCGEACDANQSNCGVCCKFETTCGTSVTQNGTRFLTPTFPKPFKSSSDHTCQLRIMKQEDICQLRLNFKEFKIAGPLVRDVKSSVLKYPVGSCRQDTFSVTSAGNIPIMCGDLAKQHIYAEFGSLEAILLNIVLTNSEGVSSSIVGREWDIEILMIPCNSEAKAPAGCLQSFEGVAGHVESFNFASGIHLANMDYSICIRTEEGMRAIEWSACEPGVVNITGPFPLPLNPPFTLYCGPGGNPSTLEPTDYLTIMGGVYYPLSSMAAPIHQASVSFLDRFCDIHFGYINSYVRTTVQPFILRFKTDDTEMGLPSGTFRNDGSTGFCLKWKQTLELIY